MPPNLRAPRVAVGALGRHWWSWGLPLHARRRGYRLFHGTNYDVPLWGRTPSVLTVHDLSLFLHPETHDARRVRRARRRLPLMTRRATLIITPTEAVRREVCATLGVAETKVAVVHEAPRALFRPLDAARARDVREHLGLGGDEFLLAVGTIEPRKNLTTLVRAFESVVAERSAAASSSRPGFAPLRLVVAGARGWLTDELFALVNTSPARPFIHFAGYLPDSDLRALYSSCAAFVYPSLYEGFGLPPLEAMACGAPVLMSRIPSLAEWGGAAARLFEPTDARDLARAVLETIGDPRARLRLSEQGRAHAARFTWQRAARETLEVYDEALKRSGARAEGGGA
ncbi:MAG TPA: glycosyltransferase family 1 protein [Pyrinomonadaceae bacterium]|nr:glycosyltransferase family 1 protein [Pyrinomonadaceae bacterium]